MREQHGLIDHFAGFVISGDVGVRKPDVGIYKVLLQQVGRPAKECVLVDDGQENLDAAKLLGFRTIRFSKTCRDESSTAHVKVTSFTELGEYLVTLKVSEV